MSNLFVLINDKHDTATATLNSSRQSGNARAVPTAVYPSLPAVLPSNRPLLVQVKLPQKGNQPGLKRDGIEAHEVWFVDAVPQARPDRSLDNSLAFPMWKGLPNKIWYPLSNRDWVLPCASRQDSESPSCPECAVCMQSPRRRQISCGSSIPLQSSSPQRKNTKENSYLMALFSSAELKVSPVQLYSSVHPTIHLTIHAYTQS
jgi:hypothetical protein